MGSKIHTTVNLDPDLSKFVDGLVNNKFYPTRSAAINEAVKLLKRSETAKARAKPDAQIRRALRMKSNVRS